jgi:hypothetical protein
VIRPRPHRRTHPERRRTDPEPLRPARPRDGGAAVIRPRPHRRTDPELLRLRAQAMEALR